MEPHQLDRVACTVSGLRMLCRREVLQVFETLDSPSLAEMDGEFECTLLDQGGYLDDLVSLIFLSNPLSGWWLGKAFQPRGEQEGHGYNWYARAGKVCRRFRMQTRIQPSRFDGRPAYVLIYSVHRHLYGRINMEDEIRKIRDGLYLGIGTNGFTARQRMTPKPFTLSGPVRPYLDAVPG